MWAGGTKDFTNIIWVIGGDADPGPVRDKVEAMVDGMRSVDSRHLFTAHNDPEHTAVARWLGSPWLSINTVDTYRPPHLLRPMLYESVLNAYSQSPAMPVFLIEAAYESEHHVTGQQLRAQAYYTVLSGGFGHIFGNCPI